MGVTAGFVTIDLCVSSAADYALKSQVLAGLPGNYYIVLDLEAVRADNALALNCARLRAKEEKQRQSHHNLKTGGRRVYHSTNFLFRVHVHDFP